MATAREYFDENNHLELGTDWTLQSASGTFKVTVKIVYDFVGSSKYYKIYIPEVADFYPVVRAIVTNRDGWNELDTFTEVTVEDLSLPEKAVSNELIFTGRITIYTPTIVDPDIVEKLTSEFKFHGAKLIIRDGRYVDLKNKERRPLAFISHDSRDKDHFVRELANKLSGMMCPVWYDEYSLVPGSSLRESIEAGLKECPKCIVVLSKNFFSNTGWSRREFDSIYTREIVEGKRVMIPIWLDVSKQDVYDYSPILIDTFGIDAKVGIDEVASKLLKVLKK